MSKPARVQGVVRYLQVGDVVKAALHLDPKGANVAIGTRGVVAYEAGEFGDDAGPLVHWDNGGLCNIYFGDVE